jgi:hypothetical protein
VNYPISGKYISIYPSSRSRLERLYSLPDEMVEAHRTMEEHKAGGKIVTLT